MVNLSSAAKHQRLMRRLPSMALDAFEAELKDEVARLNRELKSAMTAANWTHDFDGKDLFKITVTQTKVNNKVKVRIQPTNAGGAALFEHGSKGNRAGRGKFPAKPAWGPVLKAFEKRIANLEAKHLRRLDNKVQREVNSIG